LRDGARGDGALVSGASRLVGAGAERSVPRVQCAVPEARLMRVMVLGAGGMLGHDLVATAPPDVTLFPFSRTQLDITQHDAVAATLGDVRPEVVINAAGYTAVDRAESESQEAVRVNGAAVGGLGRMARQTGARLIHFSSDYVFDGQAYAPDLAAAVWTLSRKGAGGVMHVANQGEATWCDVAAHVFGRAGRPDLLTPCATADYPTRARRPRYSVLDTARAEGVLGGPLPKWEDAVERFLSSPL